MTPSVVALPPSRVQPRRARGRLPAIVLFALAACGGGGDDDGSAGSGPDGGDLGEPGGPRVLSFGSNATSIATPQDSITLSAVLTDPDGVDDLLGGDLRDDGGATLGAFATSADEGAYTLTLTWAALVAPRRDLPAEVNEAVPITLTATFYDQAGHTVERALTVSLDCEWPEGELGVVKEDGCQRYAYCGNVGCYLEWGGVTGTEACREVFGSSCTECEGGQTCADPGAGFCACG